MSTHKRLSTDHGAYWEERKKPKKRADSAHVENLTIADMRPFLHLTLEQAAAELRIGTTVLKRIARKCGIPKWPSRQITWINQKIEVANEELARASVVDRPHIQKQLQKLHEARAQVYETGKVAPGFVKQWSSKHLHDDHECSTEEEPTSEADEDRSGYGTDMSYNTSSYTSSPSPAFHDHFHVRNNHSNNLFYQEQPLPLHQTLHTRRQEPLPSPMFAAQPQQQQQWMLPPVQPQTTLPALQASVMPQMQPQQPQQAQQQLLQASQLPPTELQQQPLPMPLLLDQISFSFPFSWDESQQVSQQPQQPQQPLPAKDDFCAGMDLGSFDPLDLPEVYFDASDLDLEEINQILLSFADGAFDVAL